jgi:tRNA pseudouridine32 synthase/23S rRNA pseudouridine746 synthase
MHELGEIPEGKMFGVLLVEGGGVLKATSGHEEREGWVPCLRIGELPGERETLARLAELKTLLQELKGRPEWSELTEQEAHWRRARAGLNQRLRIGKELRAERRLREDPERLASESRADSHERHHFKEREAHVLEPLRAGVAELERQRLEWVRERRRLSRELQARMHAEAQVFPFQGEPWSLASLFPGGPPTGVGECCAPKLLHHAAVHGLRPLALAEFWWGPARAGRQPGQVYRACEARCQPLLGPLLSGLHPPLRILEENERWLAVDKPPGVLSVPGRESWNRDSVLTRLKARYPELLAVHRLDLETSGVLLFARTAQAQRELHRLFEERQVEKVYEAVLEGVPPESGTIALSLGPDPARPGRYRVDPEGKEAITGYRRLEGPRVELLPRTGRSHQLRVHMADGLGLPIVGDPLYGQPGPRLLLHCRRLVVEGVSLEASVPF